MAAQLHVILTQALDANAKPISGAKWKFYVAGTTTPLAVYEDADLENSLGSVVTADSAGVFPPMFYDAARSYRGVLCDAAGTPLPDRDFDPINPSRPDADSIVWTQDGDGAVSRSVQDKLRERVTIEDFGGVGDGVADDTAAINLFLAEVQAGKCGWVSKKTFRFTAALDTVDIANAMIKGEGGTLLYDGVSTTATMLTFGHVSEARRRLRLEGFRIHSNVVMTSGECLHIRNTTGVDIDLLFGDEYGTWRIYDGLWLQACSDIRLHSSNFCALHTGFKWNGGAELHCMNSLVKGLLVGGLGTGVGVHCGGGVGGFYSENITQIFNDIGMKIDRSIENLGNLQFFFLGGTFDSNKTHALYIDDDAVSVGKELVLDAWFASTAAGHAINIVNWRGRVTVGGQIVANVGDGIYSADAAIFMTIGKDADIRANTGYAVNSSAAWTIHMAAAPSDNGGVLGPNVRNISYNYGSHLIVHDPAQQWAIDFAAGGTKSIAAGSNFALAPGSGLVVITDPNKPDAGLFLTYGGLVIKVAGGSSIVSGAPGASQIGLQYTGGSYRVVNGYASTQAVFVGGLRSRDAN